MQTFEQARRSGCVEAEPQGVILKVRDWESHRV